MKMWPIINKLGNRYRRSRSLHAARRPALCSPSRAVVSFSFDDFPRSSLFTGGPILEEHGIAATFYASLGLADKDSPVGRIFALSDLPRVIDRGHELGCHTYAHCHAWDTASAVFEASVLENQRALQAILPGLTFATHSYPISSPRPDTKRRIARYFTCCREGGQTFNLGRVDRNSLRSFFLEKSRHDMAKVKALIDHTCEVKGWLVFSTHDIEEAPTRYGCTPSFFREVVEHAVRSGAAILPVGKAAETVFDHQPALR